MRATGKTRMVTGTAIVLAILAGASWAAPASPPVDREKIARLVEQLESGSTRERESAMEQLEAVGEPALERLRSSANSLHPRAAARAMKVVEAIGRRARDAKLLAPTMVELSLENVTVDEALAELSKQSGYEVIRAKAAKGDRRLTLRTGRVPFLRALEMVQERAGMVRNELVVRFSLPQDIGSEAKLTRQLEWDILPGEIQKYLDPVAMPASELPDPFSTIVLKEGTFTRPNGQIDGAVRVRVGPSYLSASDAERAGHPLFFRVDVEPKISVVGIAGIRIDRAIDDRGQDRTRLFAGSDETPIPLSSPESTSAVRSLRHMEDRIARMTRSPEPRLLPVTFHPGQRTATEFRELSGSIRIDVEFPICKLADIEGLSATAPSNAAYKNGDRLAIEAFHRNSNGTFTLGVNRSFVSDDSFDFKYFMNDFVPAELEIDGKRRKVEHFGEVFRFYDDRGRELKELGTTSFAFKIDDVPGRFSKFTFRPNDATSKPARLVVTGSSVETIEIPFVLKDVPLK